MSERTETRGEPLRYFTPAEAESLLPEVVTLLKGVSERVRSARELTERLADADDEAERQTTSARLDALRAEIEGLVESIARHGVEVKGVEPGLLDFPALMNGREVYLCWREGEDRIGWWHPMHTGFGGRQRIEAGQAGSFEWLN